MSDFLLEGRNIVKKYREAGSAFSAGGRQIKVLDGVSLGVLKGQAHGLVGESGCGKTTFSRILLGLEQPTSGSVFMEGRELSSIKASELRLLRRRIQVVFQDPFSSLNPRMTVEDLVAEPLLIHNLAGSRKECHEKVVSALKSVGLSSEILARYPHEFSGGQRQRICIARALVLTPDVIIADEPVSALDVSIQAQILNLLKELRDRTGVSYLFISHDFSVVRFLCDSISVMYMGRIVETAPAEEIFRNPQHPYTEALLAAVPVPDPKIQKARHAVLLNDVDPLPREELEKGCRFRNRCKYAAASCAEKDPVLEPAGEGRFCACPLRPFANTPSSAAIN